MEWMDVTDFGGRKGVPLEQNVRCSSVFRERHGDRWIAYNTEAVAFRSWLPNRGAWTGWDSARRVTFPYTPPERTKITRFRRASRIWARLRGQLRP
jgi:hypothetical protein